MPGSYLPSGDKDMIDLAEAEISELEPRLSDLEKQLKMMLLPTDPAIAETSLWKSGQVPEGMKLDCLLLT